MLTASAHSCEPRRSSTGSQPTALRLKFLLFDKTFGSHLPVTKPLVITDAALSALDPASYSLPEVSTATGPGTNCPSGTAGFHPVTSLPGCAGRPSTDLTTTSPQKTQAMGVADNCTEICCQPDLQAPRDVGRRRNGAYCTAAAAEAPPAVAGAIEHGTTRHPQLKPQQPRAPRQLLHYDRDASRHQRSYRPSIDAAARAVILYACPAVEAESTACSHGTQLAAAAAACEMPGCVPPLAQVSPPSPPPPRAAVVAVAAGQADEWNFGDNLQRARMLARYATMAAAEEMRYDPGPGVTVTADFNSDGDGCGGESPSRKSRGALRLLSSLLSSSRGAARAAAALGFVQRCQEVAAVNRSRDCSSGGDDAGQVICPEEPDLASSVVARSRDSCRLLRVQRSRVGIDRGNERQGCSKTPRKQHQQLPSGRASAPAFTDEFQQYHKKKYQTHQRQLLRQLQSRSSAPPVAMLQPDDDSGEEELNATILAAAAEFAAATEAQRWSP